MIKIGVKKDDRNNKWKFYGKYKMLDGSWKSYSKTGFKTKKEASEAERAFLAKHKNVSGITVNELMLMYMDSDHVKESTKIVFETTYNRHIKSAIGDRIADSITLDEIEKLRQEVIDKGLSVGYTNKVIADIKKIFAFGYRKRKIKQNVCAGISKYAIKDEVKQLPTNYWSMEEFDQFIKYVPERQKLIYISLFQTGMRIGECLALQWKDIDFDSGTIHIYKTYSPTTRKIQSPKTENSYRWIEVNDSLIQALLERFESDSNYDGFSTDWYVFGNHSPRSSVTTRQLMDKCIKESGVKKITLHGLRHSFVSIMIANDVDIYVLSEVTGDNPDTLYKTYLHIFEKQRKKLRNKMNDIYCKK